MPTRDDVVAAVQEFDQLGQAAFLEKYTNGRNAQTYWLKHGGGTYPLKAVWSAAHHPPRSPRDFFPVDAARALRDLGFEVVRLRQAHVQTPAPALPDVLGGSTASAVNDLVEPDAANRDPDYITRISRVYARCAGVRREVLERARANCEYDDDCILFKKQDGSYYLETHHVLSVADNGADHRSNVIALCPAHHREAHYGSRWKELQRDFEEILGWIEG